MDKYEPRPTTPHRRSNSAASNHSAHYTVDPQATPLDRVLGSGALEELSDGMATLDTNMQHLQLVHESLQTFTESFSAFLHGIKMNAWCVEFSEAPSAEHFTRDRSIDGEKFEEEPVGAEEANDTYMTDMHSFVSQPTGIPKPRPRTVSKPKPQPRKR